VKRRPERGERVSLDQLFTEWDQPPQRRRGPWLRDTLMAMAVAAAVYAVLRAFGFVSPYPVLAGTALAVLWLRRALQSIPIDEPPPAMYSPAWGVTDDDGTRFAPIDGLVRAVQRWESRFGWTERDHVRFGTAVLPRLYEVVDERLRQRHGVTMRGDPERARALVGDPLWTFLHAPLDRSPTPRETAAIVAEMEKI
jgi:hypothetical protein